ncbi:Calcium-binding EF hand family protein [Perilla frutescens var. hirtella]|nr:Calcium-binding EF hand family protein [Perilla frutescens var. hirtella]
MAQKFPDETRRSEPSADFEISAFDAVVGLIFGTTLPTTQPQQQAHNAQIAPKASSSQIMGEKSESLTLSITKAMGQILEKLQGKEWKEKQIRNISDKVFDRVKNDNGSTLTFEELYIAVLLVYNDINKRLPGRHFDPPTKEQVRKLVQESDINLDGALDREEFVKFIRRITKDTFVTVSQGLIITLAVAPTVALLTKRTTENVPGVGKVVEKIPNSVYASLVTLVIVAFQQGAERAAEGA